MHYVKHEPHRISALLSADAKDVALKRLPVESRRDARLMAFCAECEQPVVVDKMNRYRHVA